ncbi:MAG: prepilin peptidase [Candidatus Aenigmatarchaeota archaeon]
MFVYFLILISLIGSGLAGYIDLKTTEIPDKIPLLMIVFGAGVKILQFLITWNFDVLVDSIFIGGLYFAFGFAMYYTGQWGGGDAKVLAAVGFLLPSIPPFLNPGLLFPFYVSFLVNFFTLGAVYIILYTFVYVIKNPELSGKFVSNLKGSKKEISIFGIFIILVTLLPTIYLRFYLGLPIDIFVFLLPGGIGLFLLWKFLKTVENEGFKKKIDVGELEEGDMIGENIDEEDISISKKLIRGLTNEEVRKIKKVKDKVWIREGVRFAPVFPIAIVFTLLFGDIIAILI